jgi:hypothetical protein
LAIDVYPGASGELLLYEDDGGSLGYRRGEHRITRFRLEAGTAPAKLCVSVEAAGYETGRDVWTLRIHGTGPDAIVSGAGVQSVSYSERARVYECVVGEGDRTLSITV